MDWSQNSPTPTADGSTDTGTMGDSGVGNSVDAGAGDSAVPDTVVTSPTCGDMSLDQGEGCDDGNMADGDGCNHDCLIEVGASCGADVGCESNVCDTGQCRPTTCRDGLRNGGESGLDCGGTCLPCGSAATNSTCANNSDCQSGLCNGAYCADGYVTYTSALLLGSNITSSALLDTMCDSEFGTPWRAVQWHDVWVSQGVPPLSGAGFGPDAKAWKDGVSRSGRGWMWINNQSWHCYDGVDHVSVLHNPNAAIAPSTRRPCSESLPVACIRDI